MLTPEQEARHKELKKKIKDHDGPWKAALNKEEQAEYSNLKKLSESNGQGVMIPLTVAIRALDELYYSIKDGEYRSLILDQKAILKGIK